MEEEKLNPMSEKTLNVLLYDTTWINQRATDRTEYLIAVPTFCKIYFELVAIHGKLDPLVNVDLRPEKRVKVTFTCGNNSEVRSVDVYRTISDLKTKLEAFAGFSAPKMRLFYVDQELRDRQGPEEMRYPHKQLYSYNIRSGDEIIIDYKVKNRREKV